jgi:hypothetical protein
MRLKEGETIIPTGPLPPLHLLWKSYLVRSAAVYGGRAVILKPLDLTHQIQHFIFLDTVWPSHCDMIVGIL